MRPSLMRTLKINIRSVYTHITLNRVTTAFFIFSFVHCFAQGVIQSLLFSIDAEYGDLLTSITSVAAIPPQNITYLEGPHGDLNLRMCNDIPHGQPTYPCIEIFQSGVDAKRIPAIDQNSTRQKIALNIHDNGLTITPIGDNSSDPIGVNLKSGAFNIHLTPQCTQILVYPKQIMQNSQREDITFILLQFWLFAISLMAVMRDSVPHVLAVLATRSLITGWSIYAIWRTKYIESVLEELIFNPGTPCSVNLLPEYFQIRIAYEIPDLILNITALLISCYLSWTLLRVYNAQTFKCVGPPKHIDRINKFFMAVLACLQLEAFVLAAAMGLWIDVLMNTAITEISAHTPVYIGAFISTILVLIPWIVMGWYAIRRERKRLMVGFIGISFVIITGWSIMFYSIVYRWSFVQWPYLGCFTVASHILIIATMILGLICRMNFGKGLAQYLHAESILASSNFVPQVFPHDEEKASMDLDVKFEQPLPTYYLPNPPVSHPSSRPQAPYNVPYGTPF